jgi:ribosomal protein L39E
LQENKKSYDEMLLKRFKSTEDTLFFKEKLWVFESNQLKLNIIKKIHDQSAAEHSDVRRTYKYLNKWYYWSQMKESVERYVKNCHICKRSKASRNKYSELLNSLSISNRSWTNIIMNFVTELSKIKNDFNAILMIMNRLTKMHHYMSYNRKRRHFRREDNSIVDWSRLKITRIIEHDNIRSRITIHLFRLKSSVWNIEDKCEIIDNVSFRNWRSKRDRKSRDETLFT